MSLPTCFSSFSHDSPVSPFLGHISRLQKVNDAVSLVQSLLTAELMRFDFCVADTSLERKVLRHDTDVKVDWRGVMGSKPAIRNVL